MKTLLIYPYCLEDRLQEEDVNVVPIGLYYIGALLKEQGYEVDILNWFNINKTPQIIEQTLKEIKPDIIGFSILHANRWGGLEIARIAKNIDSETKIVFGGVGATFLWEHFLTNFSEIDYVVIGEGEYTFLDLIKYIEGDGGKRIEGIKGIAFRKKEKAIRINSEEPIKDLDRLPMPAKYFNFQHLSLTRGCPGKCTFCGSPQFWGHRVRFHSAEYFVNQLEHLYKRGVTFFYFSDDTFTLKKDLVIQVCQKILEKDIRISWVAISKVSYVNDEVLFWMRKAGCIQISYGVESGSEKIRGFLNKNIKTDDIKRAFELTTKYGILARAYFIYGCPEETHDTIQETLDLIHEIKPLSIVFYILDIFPGTALYDSFKKNKNVSDDIWLEQIEDIMYFETDPQLSQDLVLEFGERLRREYHNNLSGFAKSIQLIDEEDFYQMHADFCSRLGMTFSHGDYAQIDEIEEKDKTAKMLFKKALEYYPDHRAYLGLGIAYQKDGVFEKSIEVLLEGIKYFPNSDQLNMCLGINYLNTGNIQTALSIFLDFQNSPEAFHYAAICYRELGDFEKESELQKKIQLMQQGEN